MFDLKNKLPVEDRLDIQELFARYAWSLDLGDAEGVLSCFTDDGLFDHLWQGMSRDERTSSGRWKNSGMTARAGGSDDSIWPTTS